MNANPEPGQCLLVESLDPVFLDAAVKSVLLLAIAWLLMLSMKRASAAVVGVLVPVSMLRAAIPQNDLPPAYESGVARSGPGLSVNVGTLHFRADTAARPANPAAGTNQWLVGIGLDYGYDVVAIRLFDHATRKLVHDSDWEKGAAKSLKYNASRVRNSDLIQIGCPSGDAPAQLDLWLRVVELDPMRRTFQTDHPFKSGSQTIGIPRPNGEPRILAVASGPGRAFVQDSNGVIRSIEESAREADTNRCTFVCEQYGIPVSGRYYAVAVEKDGQRHVPDSPHFVDFQAAGRKVVLLFDLPYRSIDHIEWLPFGARHKFYFDGIRLPARDEESSPNSTEPVAKPVAGPTAEVLSPNPASAPREGYPDQRHLAPGVAIYVTVGMRVGRTNSGPQIIAALWNDGTVVWSGSQTSGGAPYKCGRFPPDKLAALIASLDTSGAFNDPALARGRFGPDSSITTISISDGQRRLVMRSWHELMEQNSNLVVTAQAAMALNGRDRDAVLSEQPEEYRRFRSTWAEIRKAISELIPETGEPFDGQITLSRVQRTSQTGAPTSRPSTGWSEPVEGKSMRIATDRSRWHAGETPVIRADLRSIGQWAGQTSTNDFLWRLDVDGQWYIRWDGKSMVRDGGVLALIPSSGLTNQLFHLSAEWRTAHSNEFAAYYSSGYAIPGDFPRTPLTLAPGKHTVRLSAFVLPEFVRPDERHIIGPVRVVSHPLEITILPATE